MKSTRISHDASIAPCTCPGVIQFCDCHATRIVHIASSSNQDLAIPQQGRGGSTATKVHALRETPYTRAGVVHFCGRDTSQRIAGSPTSYEHLTVVQERCRMFLARLTHAAGEAPCSCGRIVELRRGSWCKGA